MQVSLLSTTNDTRQLGKTFTTIAAGISVKPTENCSILYPRLILNYSSSYAAATHIYIPDFGRYYYIKDTILRTGSEIEIACQVDVLATYSTAIKQCSVAVVRSESIGAPTMLPDNKLPVNPNKKELLTAVSTFHPSGANCYLVRVKESMIKYVEPSREERRTEDADQ